MLPHGTDARRPSDARATTPLPPGRSHRAPALLRWPGRLFIAALLAAAVLTASAGAAQASSTTVAVAEAEQGTLGGWDVQVVADPTASGGAAVKYGYNGTVSLRVKLSADTDTLSLRLRGDQCSGAPAYSVSIDGVSVASGTLPSTSWTTATISKFLGAGTHQITVAFTNYTFVVWPSCHRALYLDNVVFSASATIAAPSSPPIPAGFVHQSGTHLLDGANQPLHLRGVDLGGWLSWEGWIWGQTFDYVGESTMLNNLATLVGQSQASQFQSQVYANYITSSDFRAMAQDGLNVARLPFNYRLLEDDTNPFVYKASGWAILDQAIAAAKANNVYLVLDMHVAPCSQTYGFTADYVSGPILPNSAQCQQRFVAMWQAIAARYAGQNAIAGYDLLNEPMSSDSQLLALYQSVTAAIRQVDPNHLIIYEGNDLAHTFNLFTKPLDGNEMLEFHDYAWSSTGDLTTRMPTYDSAATTINAPQWAGEFGQDVYTTLAHYVTVFNQDPLVAGWADWTWKESPGFAAMQTIQQTPASQMLINWIDDPTRPKPTLAQAQQGMSDFINAVQFANTMPNAEMQHVLTTGTP